MNELTLEEWKGSAQYWKQKCLRAEQALSCQSVEFGDIQEKDDDLERNAKYRAEAVQPIVDELRAIRDQIQQMRVFLKSHHDILVEILKQFKNGPLHL